MTSSSSRIPVAILGATGVVGQRLLALLADHPVFEAAELIASDKSAGRSYADAVDWRLPGEIPRDIRDRIVRPLDTAAIESPVVLSALSASLAQDAEEELARRGKAVVSNASAHRMDADVPLLIPEINAEHVAALAAQRRRREGPGFIVTNPNCSTVAVAFALAPIHRAFGVRRATIVTMQALSGAGIPGVPSLAIADNVIPHIEGEADKIETEPRRILGRWSDDRFEDAPMILGAQVHRVPVSDGHLAAISLETDRACTPEDAAQVLREFRGEPQELQLHSAPERPIHVLSGARPQPALDRSRENGMAVSVGSIARCPVLGLRLEALVHNTIRGAAGAALLNAEWLHARGLLDAAVGHRAGGSR